MGTVSSSTETLLRGMKSTEMTMNNAMKTIKAIRTHSDYAIDSDDWANDKIACLLYTDGKINFKAESETVAADSNLYGGVIAISDDFTADGSVNIPNSAIVQITGEMWFRYDSDTDAPVVGANVGVSSSVLGKVVKKYPIADEVWTDDELQGGIVHWNRYCIALQLDTDNYRVKVWLP